MANNQIIALLGGVLLVATAGPGVAAAKAPTNAEIVKQIEKLEIAAVKARTLDELKLLYSADVVDFTPSHFVVGFNSLVGNMGTLVPQVGNWDVPIVPGSLHITATSEMAVASSLQVWNSSYNDTKQPAMQMFYRQTDVWQKQADGSWKIIAAHSSIPIDPITEKPLCVKTDGYCPLPNFPHRGMNYQGVAELNKSYGPVYEKIAEQNAQQKSTQ